MSSSQVYADFCDIALFACHPSCCVPFGIPNDMEPTKVGTIATVKWVAPTRAGLKGGFDVQSRKLAARLPKASPKFIHGGLTQAPLV